MSKFLYSNDGNSPQGDSSKRLSDRFGIPEHEVKKLLYGEQARPNPSVAQQGDRSMANSSQPQSGWNPISVLGAILGIVGILSLVVVLVVLMRQPHHAPPEFGMNPPIHELVPIPPPQQAPSANMTDSCCMPEKQSVASAEPEVQQEPTTQEETPKPKAKKKAKHTISKRSGFTTSNSMEAEERLAEMKADGNTKAKITSRKKDGVLLYEVK